MTNSRYCIKKLNSNNKAMFSKYNFEGLDITPKNHINYDGIVVSKIIVLNNSLIKHILKKKVKRKLELYLQFIIDYIDDDSDTGDALNEILNDITRYRDILNYKYQKYLGEKYVDLIHKKLDLLQKELNVKLYIVKENQIYDENEHENKRTR